MIIGDVWKKFRTIGWFLPGFFLYAAFPPVMETMDVLFALAPLMWLSRQGNATVSAKRWAQSGLFFWLATLSWMPAIVKNGGPWPLVVLGWFALAAYCAAYFAAYGWLSARYWQWCHGRGTLFRLLGVLLVEPLVWCGLELIRSRFCSGFSWNQLGVVPANCGFGAPAAFGGVYLLSAVVLLINGTIAGIVERIIARIRASRRLTYDVGALSRRRSLETLLVFAVIFGLYRLPHESAAAPDRHLTVALVQRNFACCFQVQEENPISVYSNLFARVSLMKPDLIVLPESAMGEIGPLTCARAFSFVEWAFHETKAGAILAGGSRYDAENAYNSAGLYFTRVKGECDGWGSICYDVYDKVHLVPFGEYIPGDKLVPILQKLAPVGSCTPGRPQLLQLGNDEPLFLGAAICFEDTDSALVREFARQGARLLCFITNDSWFSHSTEALAHAWQATARAIETGLPVVRVGNSGVTGTITPEGKCTWLMGSDGRPLVDRAGVMTDRIPLAAPTPTPYTVFGDWPLGILFALLIGAMILVKYADKFTRGKFRT